MDLSHPELRLLVRSIMSLKKVKIKIGSNQPTEIRVLGKSTLILSAGCFVMTIDFHSDDTHIRAGDVEPDARADLTEPDYFSGVAAFTHSCDAVATCYTNRRPCLYYTGCGLKISACHK